MAMSPGQSRRSSRSISRSTRAVPTMPGRELFRESSADILMRRFCRPKPLPSWRRAVTPASIVISRHICHRWRRRSGAGRGRIGGGDLGLGGAEQFACVGAPAVGFAEAGEHAGQLGDTLVGVEAAHLAGLVVTGGG